jgi:hypothetical protein
MDDKEWHADPGLKRVIYSIIGGLFLQTITMLGTGLWWASGIEQRMKTNETVIAQQGTQLDQVALRGERIARLEVMIDKLEKIAWELHEKLEKKLERNGR